MKDEIRQILAETARLHEILAHAPQEILDGVRMLVRVMKDGGTLYVMGNGGSAADAQHLAGELIGRFEMERPAFPCVALTTDTSILTAVGNDYGMQDVFARQVEGLVTERDVVLGISTSGQSGNVVEALRKAKDLGAKTIALTGQDGGPMAEISDAAIRVPSDHTARSQEAHATIIHILCGILEYIPV